MAFNRRHVGGFDAGDYLMLIYRGAVTATHFLGRMDGGIIPMKKSPSRCNQPGAGPERPAATSIQPDVGGDPDRQR